jgi:hypothetical protein
MILFEITINGKPYEPITEVTTLTMVSEALGLDGGEGELIRRRPPERVSLMVSGDPDDPIQALAANLAPGDEVVIRVVEEETEPADPYPQDRCAYCGRDWAQVKQMIVGLQAGICDACSREFSSALIGQARLPLGASLRVDGDLKCGFCNAPPSATGGAIVRNGAAICPACLHACVDLMEGKPMNDGER